MQRGRDRRYVEHSRGCFHVLSTTLTEHSIQWHRQADDGHFERSAGLLHYPKYSLVGGSFFKLTRLQRSAKLTAFFKPTTWIIFISQHVVFGPKWCWLKWHVIVLSLKPQKALCNFFTCAAVLPETRKHTLMQKNKQCRCTDLSSTLGHRHCWQEVGIGAIKRPV